MENKKGFSILKAIIMILALIFIIVSLAVNIMFSGGKTPNILGNYVYIVGDDVQLGENIVPGSAVIAKESTYLEISVGDIVLCYPDGSDLLQLRSIYNIETDGETGQNRYYTATEIEQGTELSITKDRIPAICTGYPQSTELGKYITFTTDIKGIIIQLILPCVILLIFIIAKIISSKDDEDEPEYGFYEYDEDDEQQDTYQTASHERQNGPLFEASQEIQPSNEFERKKMSIAENFSQKRVDPNSSYQKEKERTMQFKAQRSAESSFAARNVGGQSSTAPTADALREEMLRKTAEAERTGSFSTKLYGSVPQPASYEPIDNTGILSKAQLAEMARNDVPKTAPLRNPAASVSSAVKRGSTSPDIDDIIKKTEVNQKKKSVSAMSVDDLLQMIEDEKKRL